MKKTEEIPPYRRPVLPDAELLLWEKWIQIRKEETTELAKRTERPPVDLAMNALKDVREDKERKTVLEHAQIEKKVKLRYGFWEQPQRLRQECPCEPVYEMTRTRAEKGNPPIIEHISVPNYIQRTEMGMDGDAKCSRHKGLRTTYEKYRDERETKLEKRIRKIDPFRPTSKNLIIKGECPKPPPPKIPPLPEIKIIEAYDYCADALSDVYAMRINNTVFLKKKPGQNLEYLSTLKNEKWHERCTSWDYYFNNSIIEIGRSKLFIQNLGTVSLRYCWKKIKKSIPYIPLPVYEQTFFFNKNENVLAPGQSRDIVFTFIANYPAMFSEHWELSICNVCFFETMAEKLTINLMADSQKNMASHLEKAKRFKALIHYTALSNQMMAIINEMIDNVFIVQPEIYPYKNYFSEAEIFVMKNPVCFYHQTEVGKMKVMYTELVPNAEWDLGLTSWRKALMTKEYDDRMKYYETLKNSHIQLLKPWIEREDLMKEKHQAVKYLLGQLCDKFDKEHERIIKCFNLNYLTQGTLSAAVLTGSYGDIPPPVNDTIQQQIRNIFFLHVYDHVAATMELCAGMLSSLDMKRLIEFDFCRV